MRDDTYIEILLVEDNEADVVLVREALKDAKVYNKLHVARDGEAAMEFLHRSLTKSDTPWPGLILLDLNLPRKDGREVLKEIKGNPKMRSIPVVVMTTSKDEEDIVKAYDMQANSYVTKPVDFDQLMNVVRSIEDFWLSVVQLPPSGR